MKRSLSKVADLPSGRRLQSSKNLVLSSVKRVMKLLALNEKSWLTPKSLS